MLHVLTYFYFYFIRRLLLCDLICDINIIIIIRICIKKKEKKKETNLTNNCLLKHFKILNKLIQLINNNQGMNLKSHRYLMIHIYSS